MAMSRKEEARILSKDEKALVEKTHHPEIAALGGKELADLRSRIREQRDRAKQTAGRQRREMRGKASPKGAKPAAENAGSQAKAAALSKALRRLNDEQDRRDRGARDGESTQAGMKKALKMKQAAPKPDHPQPEPHADTGMAEHENAKAEDIVDPRERGRVSEFVKRNEDRTER